MNELTTNKLAELADQINHEHSLCLGAMREGLSHAIRCGELLTEAKGTVEHGGWLPWLAENCEFSERSAQAYMRVAKRWPELAKTQRVADLSFRDALQLVAESKDPGEQDDLPEEKVISDGLKSFVDVGAALEEVRDKELYKAADYSTFGDYCADKWGLQPEQANEYIETAKLITGQQQSPYPDGDSPEFRTMIEDYRTRIDNSKDIREANELRKEVEKFQFVYAMRYIKSVWETGTILNAIEKSDGPISPEMLKEIGIKPRHASQAKALATIPEGLLLQYFSDAEVAQEKTNGEYELTLWRVLHDCVYNPQQPRLRL